MDDYQRSLNRMIAYFDYKGFNLNDSKKITKEAIKLRDDISLLKRNLLNNDELEAEYRRHFNKSDIGNKISGSFLISAINAFIAQYESELAKINNEINNDSASILTAIDSQLKKSGVGEDVIREVKARIGQQKFKKHLLSIENVCKICGLSEPSVLIASHIKPWSKSTPQERGDLDNGFLMCANHDALFDKFLITVIDNGEIIISDKIDKSNYKLLGLENLPKLQLTEANKQYLVSHRESFAIKNGVEIL